MTKIFLSYRNAKGQMKSVDPMNVPADAPQDVREAAARVTGEAVADGATVEALRIDLANANVTIGQLEAQIRGEPRKRGRPAGYKCSEDTVKRMVEGRIKTLAQKRQLELV